jgi:hypothetical protein
MSALGGTRAEERTQRLPVSTHSSRGNEMLTRASLLRTCNESQSQVRPPTLRKEAVYRPGTCGSFPLSSRSRTNTRRLFTEASSLSSHAGGVRRGRGGGCKAVNESSGVRAGMPSAEGGRKGAGGDGRAHIYARLAAE